MPTDMSAKGTGLNGLVVAMKANPELYRKLLRPAMQHYLDEDILLSGWYPMDDYVELMHVLAKSLDPKTMGGDIYRAFGLIAARRDLRGSQAQLPQDQRSERMGLYRSAVDGGLSLSGRIRRALWLRSLYYSKGHYEATRSGIRSLKLVMCDFPIVSTELCAVGTGYLIEVFHQPPKGWIEKLTCRGQGHAECAWDLRFEDSADPNELLSFGEVPKNAAPPRR